MKKEHFHSLKSRRIEFQSMKTTDAEAIHEYASDEDVSRFIGWPLTQTLDETKSYVERMLQRELEGTFLYANIVLIDSGEIIGTALMFDFDKAANHAELGYVLNKKHWGKGYGTEVTEMMSDFAFDILKLHKLHARVTSANIGSSRVLEKNKFKLEGQLRDYFFIDHQYYDCLYYGRLNSNK